MTIQGQLIIVCGCGQCNTAVIALDKVFESADLDKVHQQLVDYAQLEGFNIDFDVIARVRGQH